MPPEALTDALDLTGFSANLNGALADQAAIEAREAELRKEFFDKAGFTPDELSERRDSPRYLFAAA